MRPRVYIDRAIWRTRKDGQPDRRFRGKSLVSYIWRCELPDGAIGWGETPQEAYAKWRDLYEKAAPMYTVLHKPGETWI